MSAPDSARPGGVPATVTLAYNVVADSAPLENEWLRPAQPAAIDDAWIDRTVADAERLARARLIEGVRRPFYREGLLRPGGQR